MAKPSQIERIEAANGALIYRLPLEVFPGYFGFSHLVVYDGKLTLIDAGSGFGESHQNLVAGFEVVREEYGVPARLEDVNRVIITHGHIDHFGGLGHVKATATEAEVGLHELAKPVLTNYDERVLMTSSAMDDFLHHAGVPEENHKRLMAMFMMGKRAFTRVAVNCAFRDGDVLDDVFQIIHVPGHAPGLIMIQLADVLLTADHVLPETSVALAPESIMPYTGVGHYIESLERAEQINGVRIALGGHERAMSDYYAVVRRIHEDALQKIERVFGHCDQPRTIYEIALRIYSELDGYGELLKLEQTGARIEYLNQRGLVMIDNLDALEREHSPALRYRQV